MSKSARTFLGILAILLLVPVLVFAYEVVLKDGRVIQFQKYRASETALLYIDDQGTEISIPLSSVDLDRTRELNAKENPPLNLPGLTKSSDSSATENHPSLGETARKLRKNGPQTAKRVYDNTDLQSTSVDAQWQTLNKEIGEDPRKNRDKLSQQLHQLERFTDQQAIEVILGKDVIVQFPNRPAWESKMLAERLKYLSSLRQCLSDRVSEHDEMQRACGQYNNFKAEYDSLSQEGRARAADWKSLKEKQKIDSK
jgi:hypothetical protein